LFAELKRRNVLRAALLYVGAVWALAQGIAQLSPVVGAPEWVARWFLVAAAIGFPFWIAFAWFFEFTPDGLKRESQIDPADSMAHRTGRKLDVAIIGVLAVAVVLLLTDRFVLHHGVNEQAAISASDKSIAVLPFANLSSDKEQEYFSDGISEDLLNLLTKIPQLQVTARTSSFSFKGKDVAIPEIARQLHVAHVLQGSVRRAGNTVRITAQLVDAATDTQLWSQTYDRKLDDIFAIQDEIAADVVKQLQITLLSAAPTAKPIDAKAYPLILQAKFLLNQRTGESTAQARALYEQALALAPGEARAWDGLALVHLTQASIGTAATIDSYRLAREAALKALAIDPNDALAYSILARTAAGTPDEGFTTVAGYFQRSLELNATDSDVLVNAGRFAGWLNRLDDAKALHTYVTIHDPANPAGYYNLGLARYFSGDWDGAIAAQRTVLTLSPGHAVAHYSIGAALIMKGDAEAALPEMQAEGEGWRVIGLPLAYYALGRKAEADAALAELVATRAKEGASNIAYNYAFRGDADRAFEWLEKAVQNRDPGMASIAVEPLFRKLHQDPRWLPFLRKVGRAPEQLAKIQFKVTLPQDAKP
jgi:TolB-like protein/Tfp pilus assembly protein PilF